MTLIIKLLVSSLALIPWLFTSARYLELEALCSADSAGVLWTAVSPDVHDISLSFNCTNSNNVVVRTDEDDTCFHLLGGISSLSQTNTLYHSLSHLLDSSAGLQPGTICTFTAEVTDRYDDRLGMPITDSCTVGVNAVVLPAICVVDHNGGDNDNCQCTCSPGFEGNTQSFDGTTCTSIDINSNNSTSVVDNIPTSTPSATPTITVTKNSSTEILSNGYGMSRSGMTMSTGVEPIESTAVRMTPTPTPLPEVAEHNGAIITLLTMAAFIVSTLVVAGSTSIAVILYRRYRLQRLQDKLKMPFETLRFEKIDPNFNPIDIEAKIFVTESMHSIFHLYGSVDSEPQKYEEIDPDSQSNITEKNSYTNVAVTCETEGVETILREDALTTSDIETKCTDSAYETAQSNNLYAQTKKYLDSESIESGAMMIQGHNKVTTAEQGWSTATSSDQLLKSDVKAANDKHVKTNSNTRECLNLNNDSQLQEVDLVDHPWKCIEPAEYILPMSKPPVFFGFPEDMMYNSSCMN